MTKRETTRYVRRYKTWLARHIGPGQCPFCNHQHQGVLDYRTHLIEQHPKENTEFMVWAGLR